MSFSKSWSSLSLQPPTLRWLACRLPPFSGWWLVNIPYNIHDCFYWFPYPSVKIISFTKYMSKGKSSFILCLFHEGNEGTKGFLHLIDSFVRDKIHPVRQYPTNEKAVLVNKLWTYLAADLVADAILNLARKEQRRVFCACQENRFPLEKTGSGFSFRVAWHTRKVFGFSVLARLFAFFMQALSLAFVWIQWPGFGWVLI